jgi:hypothetical protein
MSMPQGSTTYVSSCRLDGLAATAWVDLEPVRALLGPWAEPAALPGAPRGKHPVLIEAWTVSAGRWETTFGVDAFDGLMRGWTASASRLLGPYREVAFTIPARRGGASYASVAAMYTDSPVALWGDRALASGYRKRLARIDWPSPRRCSVVTLDGRPDAPSGEAAASFPDRYVRVLRRSPRVDVDGARPRAAVHRCCGGWRARRAIRM